MTGFTLNKLGILGAVLIEQLLKTLRRFAEAGNGDLFSTAKVSSLMLTPEHRQMALMPHENASISERVMQSLFIRISVISATISRVVQW